MIKVPDVQVRMKVLHNKSSKSITSNDSIRK